MTDDRIKDTVNGFLLGLNIAEHLHETGESTFAKPGFYELICDIADGRTTLDGIGAELKAVAPPAGTFAQDIEDKRIVGPRTQRQAAMRVAEWFRVGEPANG